MQACLDGSLLPDEVTEEVEDLAEKEKAARKRRFKDREAKKHRLKKVIGKPKECACALVAWCACAPDDNS